jgi:hypothetical protein
MVYIRFLKPPHTPIKMPPAIIPIENVISIAESRHTSFPKFLVT